IRVSMAADLTAELEQLHTAAFGWALSCCGWDRSAAEDVLQATYLKLLDGRARFDGRSTFRTFVFGVIARTAREARRRAALRRWLPLAALLLGPEAVDGRPDAAAALVRADETARLVRALGRLSERQRQVLHLVFYEDLTIAEAAAVVVISLRRERDGVRLEIDLATVRWQAPTDFLLNLPGDELLRSVPQLGPRGLDRRTL